MGNAKADKLASTGAKGVKDATDINDEVKFGLLGKRI